MRRASLDRALEAIVRSPRALRYTAGEDRCLDRPAHVRAASSIGFVGQRLAIVQDDANFIALVDPRDPAAEVQSIALDHGEGGLRQFDDLRGNKRHKLDLEACVVIDGTLIAFGSGSTAAREKILVAHLPADVSLVAAHAFYGALREETAFAGSELNLEGVALVGDRLRLFNRGNGAPRGALAPIDATCDVSIESFLAHLRGGPVPGLESIIQYDLGAVDGVRLGFTDAARVGARTFYLAAAEASPDATRDGPVAGVAIGVLDELRYARVCTEEGPFDGKAEGIAFDPDDPRRGWLVIDRDEPLTAGELWELELRGDWPTA